MVKHGHIPSSALAVLVIAACGPASPARTDGSTGGGCSRFDCGQIAGCSSLSARQCDELCDCFPDQWRAGAFDTFAACMSQCSTDNSDTYSTCFVSASFEQPTFVNPQYISNCEAKMSVCPAYPSDACGPVNLALLNDGAFADIEACLSLECDAATACAYKVLYCEADPP